MVHASLRTSITDLKVVNKQKSHDNNVLCP